MTKCGGHAIRRKERTMLKAIAVTLALLMFLFAGGCALRDSGSVPAAPTEAPADTEEAPTPEYRRISAEEAKERIDSGREVIVLDVRTEAEFLSGHIPDAVLLPNETIGTDMPEELPDLDAEILIYCRSGNRSRQAAEKLVAMGYTGVYDFGGIGSWPYDVVTVP
jgi:phage shock protein E